MKLVYHPDAEEELLDAVRFYQRRVTGLGERFLREFDAAISRIQAAPDRWAMVEGDIRRYLMRRFPYAIYYRHEEDCLRILVVKHHSRHPDYWKCRIGE
jgi:plasmid stabilization system protein ParE